MPLTEPITTLTDYAIALESLGLGGVLLWRGWARRQRSIWLWGLAFVAVAGAAALGGTCHGFVNALGNDLAAWLWRLMVCALSVASLLMLLAALSSQIPRRWQRWSSLAAVAKSAVFLDWTIAQSQNDWVFSVGVADYLSSMLVVLGLMLIALARSTAAGWIVAGVLVSAVAIVLQSSNVTLTNWFNHNDLYHLVQMLALYLFFRGGSLLKDA